jgi:hypothetical protein
MCCQTARGRAVGRGLGRHEMVLGEREPGRGSAERDSEGVAARGREH